MLNEKAVELAARAARLLAGTGCRLGPGLTGPEFARIEREYGFEFADDHRAFLAVALPLNTPNPVVEGVYYAHAEPWPDWRDGDPESLRKSLDWPVEGVLFDIEHNAFWDVEWGAKPPAADEAIEAAKAHLAEVPQMVPVYGHRYLPPGHGTYGHAVLSMYQTDIISYGYDLADYIVREFDQSNAVPFDGDRQKRLTVPFWSQFV